MKKIYTYLLALFAMTTIVSCNDDKDEPQPIEPIAEPTIAWKSNPNFEKQDITEKMDVKINIEAPAGIKTFKLGIESGPLNNEFNTKEIDLIEPDESLKETVETLILGDAGSQEGKTSCTLDLTKLVLKINELTTEESDHKFTVTVGDKNNKTVSQTFIFHRMALPAPTITWESNPDFEKKDILNELDVKITVDAPAGIKTFKLGIESGPLNNKFNTKEIDLIEPDESLKETVETLILGEAGSPDGKTSYTLDLTKLVLKVNELTIKEGDHEFTVTVVDRNEQTATVTAVFHRALMDFTETVSGVTFDMVYVKGGTFRMGATEEQGLEEPKENEYPVHSVTLSDYYIGRYEVTQALWEKFMKNWSSNRKGGDYPVECMDWDQMQEFLTKLNKSTGKNYVLPTEAQWEYAARGGAKSKGYKYSGSDDVDDVAWYGHNSGGETHPVGEKKANELGLYDMSGNVYEWCCDWYCDYSSEPQTDPMVSRPTVPETLAKWNVIRGGSWEYDPIHCRVSYRTYNMVYIIRGIIGFRLALIP